MDLYELFERPIELRPIGNLCEAVASRFFVKRLDPLLERRLRRSIVQLKSRAVGNTIPTHHRNQMNYRIALEI